MNVAWAADPRVADTPSSAVAGGPACVIGARGRVLVAAGQNDAALRVIESELVGPSFNSVPILLLAPDYDPIRSDPRFQALLRKYAPPVAVASR